MNGPTSPLRIGDAERDATVQLLNRHYADGRITLTEHDERTTAALAATTQPDLDALLADLPDLRRTVSAQPPVVRPGPSPVFGLLRLVLAVALVVFAVTHLVPILAIVAAIFILNRMVFGCRGSWGRAGRV